MEGRARPRRRRACWATRSRRCASSPCWPRRRSRATAQTVWERIGLPGRSADRARARRRPAGAATPAALTVTKGDSALPPRRRLTVSRRTMGWFDSHCHLDDDGSRAAPTRCAGRGAGRPASTGFVTVGATRRRPQRRGDRRSPRRTTTSARRSGLHPHDAGQRRRHRSSTLLDRPDRVVAVGECGLDYYYDHSPRDVQRAAFAAQIALAHERAPAAGDPHPRGVGRHVRHPRAPRACPSAPSSTASPAAPDEARQCLDLGAFLSFSRHRHVQDRRRPASRRRAVPRRPPARRDRQPVPRAGPPSGPANQPAFVPLVGARVAEVRGVNVSQIEHDTEVNARVAFRLTQS